MSIVRYGQPGPLRATDGNFYDKDGHDFTFQGVSWAGFEAERGMLDGLNKAYQNRDLETGLVRDYKVVAARIKLLGFNTIRVPFSFANLLPDPRHKLDPLLTPWTPNHKDDNVDTLLTKQFTAISAEELRINVTHPLNNSSMWGQTDLTSGFVQQALAGKVPGQRYTNQIAGAGYPPDAQANVLKRFLDTVSDLVAMGFFVLLDNQMQQDKLVRTYLGKPPEQRGGPANWVDKWKALMTLVYALPDIQTSMGPVRVRDHVLVDILNEPDYMAIQWEPYTAYADGHDDMFPKGTKMDLPGATDLYLEAMDAIHALPGGEKTLFFVEGTGSHHSINWGDNFSGAGRFLSEVVARPYVNNVVISPHVYPPSVSQFNNSNNDMNAGLSAFLGKGLGENIDTTPSALSTQYDELFGYLTQPVNGHKFPICIGETGSAFVKWPLPPPDNHPDAPINGQQAGMWGVIKAHFRPQWDPQYLQGLQLYFKDKGIHNFIFWAYNANGGDTGGLVTAEEWQWVQNTDPDKYHPVLPRVPADGIPWQHIVWDKIDWMVESFGLKPWYLQ